MRWLSFQRHKGRWLDSGLASVHNLASTAIPISTIQSTLLILKGMSESKKGTTSLCPTGKADYASSNRTRLSQSNHSSSILSSLISLLSYISLNTHSACCSPKSPTYPLYIPAPSPIYMTILNILNSFKSIISVISIIFIIIFYSISSHFIIYSI